MFRKLDHFLSSGNAREMHTLLGTLEREVRTPDDGQVQNHSDSDFYTPSPVAFRFCFSDCLSVMNDPKLFS
jgi:hypothetical protein